MNIFFKIDSWARMFLMFEASKTYDCYSGNLLMRREGLTENDKLIAGPAWDYDVSFGRTLHKFVVGVAEPIQLNAEGWYNDSIGLFAVDKPVSLLQELGKHASFMRHVAEVYNEYRAAFEDIPANVDRQQSLLRDSAMMNNVLWGTQSLCADYLVSPTGIRVLDALKELNTCRHIHTTGKDIRLLDGSRYVGTEVCTDCGKVLNPSKIVTPAGTIHIPVYTVKHAFNSVQNAIYQTANRVTFGLLSRFG